MVFEKRVPISKLSKRGRTQLGASYRKKLAKRNQLLSAFRFLVRIGSVVGGVFFIVIAIYLFSLSRNLPDVTIISNIIPDETTKIYSSDGVILAELHKEENRIIVPYSRISDTIKKSVIALEDNRFYRHHGIDPIGIMRAIVVDVIARKKVQGASTLTQQLARHLFLTKQKRISRKLSEMLLAIKIERHYTKEEILHMYLNQVYWGHNAYGIESAAKMYFNKHAKDLTLAESCMLTGMLQAPELYSPFRNLPTSLKRKDVVLRRLYQTGVIDRTKYQSSKKEKITLAQRKKVRYKAPYFTSMIIDQLIELYGEEAAYSSGMKVYTPLNYRLQSVAEKSVDWAISENKRISLNMTQAALLAVDPRTGYIITMVGGHDFINNQFNKTTQAKRQPGSSFKPFIYLTALSKKFSPGSILNDSPITFNTLEGPYSPQNYSHKFRGKMPMRKALEKSVNVIAIKIIDLIKPESVMETARKLGITTPIQPVLSMALGSQEVSMMEMTSAYGVFATGGKLAKPIYILKIEDRNGVILFKNKVESAQVFSSKPVYALVELMKGVVNYGTGRRAKLPRPMAGKTGTTSDYRDAWFIGYVPQLVVAAWVGNDDNSPMERVFGGWFPAMMWKQYMKVALNDIPRLNFPKPAGLVYRNICWTSGKRTTEFCPKKTKSKEKFWVGYAPREFCDIHTSENQSNESKQKKQSWINDFLN